MQIRSFYYYSTLCRVVSVNHHFLSKTIGFFLPLFLLASGFVRHCHIQFACLPLVKAFNPSMKVLLTFHGQRSNYAASMAELGD